MNIKIIYSNKHIDHNPPYEIYNGAYEPYAEKAERIESIVKTLRANGIGSFYKPSIFPLNHIKKIHQREYTSFLRKESSRLEKNEILYPSYFIMDTYTPIVSKTYASAKTAVDVALTGAKYMLEGEQIIYVLQRTLNDIRAFNPNFLIISAGFDTYEKDPIGGFGLTIPFYEKIGNEISKLQLPKLIVQEGGYYIEDLGKITLSFLEGILV